MTNLNIAKKKSSNTISLENIDEIIGRLTEIIETSIKTKSRQGYFAALYRKVTIKVREGIEQNYFDDGERMERFDVFLCQSIPRCL